jgi:hypothetical protein
MPSLNHIWDHVGFAIISEGPYFRGRWPRHRAPDRFGGGVSHAQFV